MRSRMLLIPRLAATGIRRNGIVYLPYILTMALSASMLCLFSCIVGNPMLDNVPHAVYTMMLLQTGKGLLCFVLFPFLFYTNSFLIKRRKKELGLYTVLGLEKKHIAVMMFLETLLIYIVTILIGFVVAAVFGKLVFAFLLKTCSMPVGTEFTMDAGSFITTAVFFAAVSLFNLASNLWQVTMVNPTDLMKESKRGEKEPKHLVLASVAGCLLLGGGYYMTMTCQLDSLIFLKFPFAVMLVASGTYFLFTSGSILFLKKIRGRKSFYYKKENYICIAGMLYRMKKSAAGLVNICIFSTMVIITLICTVSLRLGEEDAIRFRCPYDFRYYFTGSDHTAVSDFENGLLEAAERQGIKIVDFSEFPYGSVDVFGDGNVFVKANGELQNKYTVRLLALEDYNRIEECSETLSEGEVLFYSNQADFGYDSVNLQGTEYRIKKELDGLKTDRKEEKAMGQHFYYIVMKDRKAVMDMAGDNLYYAMQGNLQGETEAVVRLLSDVSAVFHAMPNGLKEQNYYEISAETKALNGGLLFIGVFFGLMFAVCLVLVMYYKQITEGFEDQDSFHIMKKVGMSDRDIRGTIKKQIMMVFGLPLIVALIHTVCSMNMTVCLLYTLNLFHTGAIYMAAAVVAAVFLLFYAASYLITAKTYYKIIR